MKRRNLPQWMRAIMSTALIAILLAGGITPLKAHAGEGDSTDNPHCVGVTRTLDVVAHQDDDLLFINPDLQKQIKRGECTETVFVTAGDAGHPKPYWKRREEGIHAAYAHMAGKNNVWIRTRIAFGNKRIVRDTLKGNPKIRVLFMRLPDGKIPGTGFASTHYQSLRKLWQGRISYIKAVDASEHYSKTSLEKTLAAIMLSYNPQAIRTLNVNGKFGDGDHTDHVATAYFTAAALQLSGMAIPLYAYQGYPMKSLKVNLANWQTREKRNTFFVYEKTADGVCQSLSNCHWEYRSWLPRRYLSN